MKKILKRMNSILMAAVILMTCCVTILSTTISASAFTMPKFTLNIVSTTNGIYTYKIKVTNNTNQHLTNLGFGINGNVIEDSIEINSNGTTNTFDKSYMTIGKANNGTSIALAGYAYNKTTGKGQFMAGNGYILTFTASTKCSLYVTEAAMLVFKNDASGAAVAVPEESHTFIESTDNPVDAINSDAIYGLGDVDYDEYITSKDATEILVYYSYSLIGKTPKWTTDKKRRADYNEDGKINSKDATAILKDYAKAILA